MFREQSSIQSQHSNKLWYIFIIPCFIFISFIHSFASTQVSLEWNPNSEPNLAGYRVFCHEEGKSYDYTNPIWEGTNNYCTIYNQDETKTCYFVVRAFDTEGLKSGDSNEVRLEAAPEPVNEPPTATLEADYIEASKGTIVTLDGSKSSDADDGIVSYLWTQVDGKPVNLSDPVSKITTFIAPETDPNGTNLNFKLTVTDSGGLKSTADCMVYVTQPSLKQEAEAGIIFGAFEIVSDPAASDGQYVHVPNGTGRRMDRPEEVHKIEYTFNVPETGIYRIKEWVHAANGNDDSFRVKVNGSPSEEYLWDVFVNTSYQTDYVSDRDGKDPVEVMLEAGINVVTIYLREDGTRLDKIDLEPLLGN
jgi:K319L-like, PKD domain